MRSTPADVEQHVDWGLVQHVAFPGLHSCILYLFIFEFPTDPFFAPFVPRPDEM